MQADGQLSDAGNSSRGERDLQDWPDEVVVRRYLLSVADPDLIFDARQMELEARRDAASDVLDRLSLAGEVIRYQQSWRAALEDAFIRRARRWVDRAHADVASMRRLGVSAATLAAAGLADAPFSA